MTGKKTVVADYRRRSDDAPHHGRWAFKRTVSADSLVAIVAAILSGIFSATVVIVSMRADIQRQDENLKTFKEQTKSDIGNVQKSVEIVDRDQRDRSKELADRTKELARDQAERAGRLEAAINDQSKLVQSLLIPRLQR